MMSAGLPPQGSAYELMLECSERAARLEARLAELRVEADTFMETAKWHAEARLADAERAEAAEEGLRQLRDAWNAHMATCPHGTASQDA
jgi:hypothetical protein